MSALEIRRDDLSGPATRALVAHHLTVMRGISPAESCHALDLVGLQDPAVEFWSAWFDDDIAGIGALMRFEGDRGELKSMRVADGFLGRGVGRAILHHLESEARAQRLASLWLETGTTDEFRPARRLYESEGFRLCEPFGSYVVDPFSVYMTKSLTTA